MKKIIFVLFFGFSLCMNAQVNPLEDYSGPIQIALGDEVDVNGVLINFVEVLEESRCPKNVTCVWEGRVRIKIKITAPKGNSKFQELVFGKVSGDEPSGKSIFENSEFSINGLAVTPYPKEAGEKMDYCLIVDVRDLSN